MCVFLHDFILREPCKNTTAVEKGKIVISRIKKVIETHFPELFQSFNGLTDRRKRKEYLLAELVTGALFMYIFKETSRNGYNNDRRDACFRKNFFKYFGINLSSGLSISLASEFIENTSGRDYEKQDCEQKAFVRLAAKIKKHFPRLPICILGDGLYPNNTVFDICAKNNWLFIITLKDGNLKTFQTEVNLLRSTTGKRSVYRKNKTSRTTLDYAFLNEVEYAGRYFSWVECRETLVHTGHHTITHQRFVYITNVAQNQENVVITADSGRLRWKIENEGFNTQKNLGYGLEHKFSRTSYTAMQNYYHLLQIAHMINQLVERSKQVVNILMEHSKQTIVDLWKKLIAYLAMFPCEENIPTTYLSG